MILPFCAVCGTTEGLHQHHLEPVIQTCIERKRKKGYDSKKPLSECDSMEVFAFLFDQGVISDDGTITVCDYHHNILHGILKFQMANHINLIKKGLERARANGTKLGRPSVITEDVKYEVLTLRKQGVSIKKLANQFNIGVGTVYSILESPPPKNFGVLTYLQEKNSKS